MRVGIGVGYSGVKLPYDTSAAPAVRRLPVGAAPASTCVVDLSGQDGQTVGTGCSSRR